MKPWETPRMGDDDDDGTLGIICTYIYMYIYIYYTCKHTYAYYIYMMCNVYVCIQLRIYR